MTRINNVFIATYKFVTNQGQTFTRSLALTRRSTAYDLLEAAESDPTVFLSDVPEVTRSTIFDDIVLVDVIAHRLQRGDAETVINRLRPDEDEASHDETETEDTPAPDGPRPYRDALPGSDDEDEDDSEEEGTHLVDTPIRRPRTRRFGHDPFDVVGIREDAGTPSVNFDPLRAVDVPTASMTLGEPGRGRTAAASTASEDDPAVAVTDAIDSLVDALTAFRGTLPR